MPGCQWRRDDIIPKNSLVPTNILLCEVICNLIYMSCDVSSYRPTALHLLTLRQNNILYKTNKVFRTVCNRRTSRQSVANWPCRLRGTVLVGMRLNAKQIIKTLNTPEQKLRSVKFCDNLFNGNPLRLFSTRSRRMLSAWSINKSLIGQVFVRISDSIWRFGQSPTILIKAV